MQGAWLSRAQHIKSVRYKIPVTQKLKKDDILDFLMATPFLHAAKSAACLLPALLESGQQTKKKKGKVQGTTT